MLNIRFIIKMLGMMFILETLFMLAATAVAFLYEGNDFYPLLQSSGIMFGTGVLFMLIGLRANEHTAGRGRDADCYIDLGSFLPFGDVTILFRWLYR